MTRSRRRLCAFLTCSTIFIVLTIKLVYQRLNLNINLVKYEIKNLKPVDIKIPPQPTNNYFESVQLEIEKNKDNDGSEGTHLQNWILETERQFIRDELKEYSFPGLKNLDDFIIEEGGQQIKNIIVSTWRSGSSFVAEIMRSLPATFYNFEPLVHLGAVQINNGPNTASALSYIRQVLHCNYNFTRVNLTQQEEKLIAHWILGRNPRLWNYCKENGKLCMSAKFLSDLCQIYPFQILKTVRLRLDPAKILLAEDSTLKLLLIIRDPRGIMSSRAHIPWCFGQPACADPKNLCSDLVQDYHVALELLTQYPDQFMILRYEDLALNVLEGTRKIFQFFGLQDHPKVQLYLQEHTKFKKGGAYSTHRDSQGTPFKWMETFKGGNFSVVQKIQMNCQQALQLWGYNEMKNNWHPEFKPMRHAPFPQMILD